jgi:preprotein translocase subunit SecA
VIEFIARKIFGSKNERELRRIQPLVARVAELEPSFAPLTDEGLRACTPRFRERLQRGEELDALLPEAFAAVREASRRVTGMRHFDAQVVGGVVLHEGTIAEMKTGEGKTLVATLPIYLNALAGRGVHLVTVNDYLARRDSEWMGPIYRFLGLAVGVIQHDMGDQARQAAYRDDVTYGTNNEFGFDYLRDNMKFSLAEMVQRDLHYAIVDEVDSILVDEARTPLIISGPAEESTELYYTIGRNIPRLRPEQHYTVDEKARTVMLTEAGVERTEKILGVENLYDPRHIEVNHHVQQALRAHALFKRDVDYVVKDGQVLIVDEFTGRLMPGRRYSEGLHQALEAKEGVKIESENQTLASITFQNYFRMYGKLAGMTGTADTEAPEFKKIYDLDVTVIPTHRPMIRSDHSDVVYRSRNEKYSAVVDEIADCHRRGQPVLVGTTSIENSETLSRLLKSEGIPHHVLNAKHHEREAEIVAQAGRKGAVTIATNMAGRGTDILLGGNPAFLARSRTGGDEAGYPAALEEFRLSCAAEHDEVTAAGGLHILGTERHESRRIDNQLRGRSGRQGDPGTSRFYLSLEDDLLRIFGSDRISGLMGKLGMTDGQPIEHGLVTRAIENAQKKVEARNFDIRKHLLEYDDVMNKQREVVYGQRREILGSEDVSDMVREMTGDLIDAMMDAHVDPKGHHEEWDLAGLAERFFFLFGGRPPAEALEAGREEMGEALRAAAAARYAAKEAALGAPLLRHLEKGFLLQILDAQWKDHLYAMDQLRQGIGLRGYGQRDPLSEYKMEGFAMFADMMERVKEETVRALYLVQVAAGSGPPPVLARRERRMTFLHPEAPGAGGARAPAFAESAADGTADRSAGEMGGRMFEQPSRQASAVAKATADKPGHREGPKVGRNDPCPCGSGRKFKKCCGAGS